MALTAIGDILTIPCERNTVVTSYVSAAGTRLDATGERIGSIFMIRTAGNIAKIYIRTGTVTTGDTLKVSLQGVTSGGLPDGTILATATGNKAYGTVAVADGDDNVWKEVTLTEVAPVIQGQYVAIVIEWNSYVAGDMYIAISSSSGYYMSLYNVYTVTDVTASPGTWIRSVSLNTYTFALEYDDTNYYQNIVIGPAVNTVDLFHTGTVYDEQGNYVTFPFSFRAIGFWVFTEADQPFDMILYDSSSNVLANCSPSNDIRYSTSTGFLYYLFDSNPASNYTIAASTYYRIVMKPTSATNTPCYYFTVPAASAMSAFGLGGNCIRTTRVDGGAWTNYDTQRCAIGLLYDQIDIGGGGGAPRFGDMTGGLK